MRNTPLVEAVKDIFESAHRPVSVPEMQTMLSKKKLEPNKTSLYRMLRKLKDEGFINEVLIDSKTVHYERKMHDHYHFNCEGCEVTKCIDDQKLGEKIGELEKELSKKGLSVKQHYFSISGLCEDCSS